MASIATPQPTPRPTPHHSKHQTQPHGNPSRTETLATAMATAPTSASMATTTTSQRNPQPAKPPVLAAGTPNSTSKAPRPAATLSFAAVAAQPKNKERFPDVPLPSRQYGLKEGVPSITFSVTEHQALTNRIRHTVIAKFQSSRPTLAEIKTFAESHWRVKGKITMSSKWDGRHVVFLLDSEEDVSEALTCPFRKVQHSYFRLFRWTPDYNPKKESTLVTKWIKLPDLPMEFFTRSCVKAIVSSFARKLNFVGIGYV